MNIQIMALDAIRSLLSPPKKWMQRNKCIKKGQKVKISYGAEVKNSTLNNNVFIAHHASCIDSEIGDYTSIGRYTKVRCAEIGKYCSISWDSTIGAVAHPLTKISTCALTYKAEYHLIKADAPYPQQKVIIGNDVWIGCNVVILSGVKINDGAVIGAGSVVTKDIPPYAIVAGNPARIIRYRVDEALIPQLLDLKWWNWNLNSLRENLDLLSEDINEDVLSQLMLYKKIHF